MPAAPTPAPAAPEIILLPAERFFVRRVALAPEAPAEGQLELALETLSPFGPTQLYHGFLPDPSGRDALLYAAHRRNFTAEETASWVTARAVLPAFVSALGTGALPPAGLAWRRQGETLEVSAYDGQGRLPVVLLARPLTPEADLPALRSQLLDEARQRAGLPGSSPVRELPAHLSASPDKKGGVLFTFADHDQSTLAAGQLDTLDVRDRAQLAAQRRTARRDLWLWRAFAAGCAGLAACLVLELALLGGRFFLQAQHTFVEARSGPVEQIKSTQELATRLGQMSSQQLRPFEMLAAVNAPRPASINFIRVSTTGRLSLEVEAQTANSGDLGVYEGKLKAEPGIAQVELRDPRSRDGLTSFLLVVTFRPDFLKKGAGS